jgi:prophage regulatory protein
MRRNIIRKPVVEKRTGLSGTTIWRLEKAGNFPQRLQLTGGGIVGWFEDEIDAWIHDRVRTGGKRPPGRCAGQRRDGDQVAGADNHDPR